MSHTVFAQSHLSLRSNDSKVEPLIWQLTVINTWQQYTCKLLHDCQMRDELIDENKKRNYYAFSRGLNKFLRVDYASFLDCTGHVSSGTPHSTRRPVLIFSFVHRTVFSNSTFEIYLEIRAKRGVWSVYIVSPSILITIFSQINTSYLRLYLRTLYIRNQRQFLPRLCLITNMYLNNLRVYKAVDEEANATMR